MILLLSGYAGSGKDTIADWICLKYPRFTKLSIASSLKEYTSKKYNFDVALCYTQEGKKTVTSNGKTVRDLLIREARELKDLHGDDYHINKIVSMIKQNPDKSYVVSDVRYVNEITRIQEIRDTFCVTMRVVKDHVPVLEDSSEHQLDTYPFTYYVHNDSSLSKLYSHMYDNYNFILEGR